MAKKKAAPTFVAGRERISVITVKGSTAFRDWLAYVSSESRIASTVIVRDALAAWAKANDYPKPPEI